MAKISTGLRDGLLVSDSLKGMIDGGVIKVYSGPVPATADAALAGNTLLCVISNDAAGTGISMDSTPASGILGKNPAETWRGLVLANGTASFYRFVSLADDGTLSTTQVRIQGTVGVMNADLLFSNVNFVSGVYKSVDNYYVAQPTA